MSYTEEKDKLLKYYEGQWTYRNTHYWKLVTKDVLIGIIIILFPKLCGYFKMESPDEAIRYLFPIVGVVVSFLFTYLLLCESARMTAVSNVKNKLISDINSNYVAEKVKRIYRINLSKVIPFSIFAFHIIVAVIYA